MTLRKPGRGGGRGGEGEQGEEEGDSLGERLRGISLRPGKDYFFKKKIGGLKDIVSYLCSPFLLASLPAAAASETQKSGREEGSGSWEFSFFLPPKLFSGFYYLAFFSLLWWVLMW